MEPLFKNSILFIAGFIVALVLFRHPESIDKLKAYNYDADQSEVVINDSRSNQKPNFDKLNERPTQKTTETQRPQLAQNFFNNSRNSRPSLDAVPNLPEQTPTAPPTGRPHVEGEEEEKDEEKTNTIANNTTSRPAEDKPKYDYKSKDSGEASFSSMASFVGVATMDQSKNGIAKSNATSGVPVSGAGGYSGGYTGGNSSGGNEDFDIDGDFTQAGLQNAKRLYNNKSITEAEYLEYISMGLESTNTAFKTSAATELVNLRTDNAFALQAQFASSSNANTQILNTAVAAAYRTPGDLLYLSQRIADNSSVMSQSWAVHSLDVVISGSNMDFSNQQVRDTLVNNVYSSLVGLDRSHPSFGLAQSISKDINSKLS